MVADVRRGGGRAVERGVVTRGKRDRSADSGRGSNGGDLGFPGGFNDRDQGHQGPDGGSWMARQSEQHSMFVEQQMGPSRPTGDGWGRGYAGGGGRDSPYLEGGRHGAGGGGRMQVPPRDAHMDRQGYNGRGGGGGWDGGGGGGGGSGRVGRQGMAMDGGGGGLAMDEGVRRDPRVREQPDDHHRSRKASRHDRPSGSSNRDEDDGGKKDKKKSKKSKKAKR